MSLSRIQLILTSYLIIFRNLLLVADRVKLILALVVYPLIIPAMLPIVFILMAFMHSSNLQEEGLYSKDGGIKVGIQQSVANDYLLNTLERELPSHSIEIIAPSVSLREAINQGLITYGMAAEITDQKLTGLTLIYDKTKQRQPVVWLDQAKDAFPYVLGAMRLAALGESLPPSLAEQLQSQVSIKVTAFGETESQLFYFVMAGLIWMYAIYGGYYLIRDYLFEMYQHDRNSDFISHLLSIGIKPIELIIARSIVLFSLSLIVVMILLSWVNVVLQVYAWFVQLGIDKGMDFTDPQAYSMTIGVYNFIESISVFDWLLIALVSSLVMLFYVVMQKVVLVYSKDPGSALLNGRVIEFIITLMPTAAFFLSTLVSHNTPFFNGFFMLTDLMRNDINQQLVFSFLMTTLAGICIGFYLVNRRMLSLRRFC
jgi:hypothetical protein